MGLLDAMVGKFFRDEKAGRVVVLPVDGRNRGYLVRSQSEELKIRAFLKMFCFAELSLQLVGLLVTVGWIVELGYVPANSIEHFVRSGMVVLGIYLLAVALPCFLLLTTYKKAVLSFVSAEDEVAVSGKSIGRQHWAVILGVLGLATLIGFVLFVIRTK